MKTNIRFLPAFVLVSALQAFAFAGNNAPEKISYDSVAITQPYIAITFDDGPSSMLTPQVLKILADRNIKATFFTVGEEVQAHPEIIKQEITAGHEVGSRSWSHSGFVDVSDKQWISDIQHTDQALKMAMGRSPKLFCPFDTSFTDLQCQAVNQQFGYKVIYWNVDSLAVKAQGPAAIVNQIISQAKPGCIIMSSDIDPNSVQALPYVIDKLVTKGYKFVTVSDLISFTTPAGQKKLREENPVAVSDTPKQAPRTAYTPPSSGGFHPFGVATPPEITTPSAGGTDQQ